MKRLLPLLFVSALAHANSVEPLRLSMRRAVELALGEEGSATLQLAREVTVQARSRSIEAKSALLPNFEVSAGVQSLTRNLNVLGLSSSTLGFPIPDRVGPFNVVDARAGVGQAVVDISSLYRYKASRSDVLASEFDAEAAAEQVAAVVAGSYLGVLRAEARVHAETANVELAASVLEVAQSNRRSGTGTGLEVTRAEVRVAAQRQALLIAQNEKRRAELGLRRAIGLRLDVPLELTDTLAPAPANVGDAAQALSAAIASRSDWKAQLMREQRAELVSRSASAERLPSVQAFADYGAMGSSPVSARGTHTAGLSVQIPVFDGGRRRAHADAANSVLRQEKARKNDLQQQIQFEIEVAADRLASSLKELELSDQALQLALRSFEHARRRYAAGAADDLAVAEAQNELARARDNRIAGLYASNLAWLELHKATGRLRRELTARD